MKKLLNVFLIILLCVSLKLLTSCAIPKLEHIHNYVDGICILCKEKSSDHISKGLEYELNDDNNSYSVISIGTCTDIEIIIPSEYNNLPVTKIGEKAFIGHPNLEKVIIPISVTIIGNSAFQSCHKLKKIELPDSIINIGKKAFENCPKLEYKNFNNAKYLGNNANPYLALISITNKSIIEYKISDKTKIIYGSSFEECYNLTKIEIPASVVTIEAGEFASCIMLENIEVDEKNNYYKSIDGNLYSKDEKTLLKYATGKENISFDVPLTVENIEKYAFKFSDKLEHIELPNAIINIGEGAFYGCSSLTNITLPDKITKIDSKTFSYCENLTNIEIPTGVISIEKEAFSDCIALTKVVIPDSIKNIGDEAFIRCEKLVDVEIPSSITSIGTGIFSGCYNLNCYIYEGIKYLGNKNNPYLILFAVDNKDIENVEINNNTKFIMSYAFYNCIFLKNVAIPIGVVGIGDLAFYNCENLERIELPNSIINLGSRAFSGCVKLKNIDLSNNIISIGEEVFHECSALQYNIYENIKYLGNKDNPYLILVEPTNKNLISYKINESTKIISPYAFNNCVGLSTIIIPNSVEIIGYNAFRSCERLTNVIIPDSVIYMSRYVFSNCPRLTILCASQSKPSGWEKYWNADNRPVKWGYIEK